MNHKKRFLNRREMLAGAGAGFALSTLATARRARAASVSPFTIVINQSPWFESFRKTVELYEKESGNKVELDVNPFAGSLEKQRNSVRAARGQYDLLIMNSGWFAEMYFGGFVDAISDIDPGFKLDPDVYSLGETIYFDPVKKTMTKTGKLMSMPISPLIPLLYYRGDLYKEAGLKAPETFAELETNARHFQKPPRMYGIVQRGARGPHTVAYDFYPYLYGFGGGIFKDQAAGDYSVVLNDEKGRTALDYYVRLAKEAGHPKTASLDQAEVIQNMVTGKTAHIMMVIAAWSQMDDPAKSAVVDKVEFAPTPHAPGLPTAPGLGHWLGGIARNVPDDRKRAAVEFLRWFQTREAQVATAKLGGIPINAAAYRDPISQERQFRWMKPLAESLPHAVNIYQFPEASEVIAILELGLNRAVAGEITSVEALNSMSDQIQTVMAKYNYNTGKLPPLR
ncbi:MULTISPECIES: extracellular solute-binding protein [unclassified Chelatococcus]|uniref:extracellular solute-binding protein n=1 Tax=unclassified Chelatococcus TaxID=2638111 RepID=UPI001BCAE086|nr:MULTISPECIES: extracellular solute-binding protein [unclassified Chelatococcus]MBS7701007.1 extracellular solute-binding protein [Chelatococcus sp. YT9]MBX3555540.1 extracellular solute-binding protein [Chelatococcus sp.]